MVIKPLNEHQLGSARINVDFEKNVIRLNQPEKNSNARMWRVHTKLTAARAVTESGKSLKINMSYIVFLRTEEKLRK